MPVMKKEWSHLQHARYEKKHEKNNKKHHTDGTNLYRKILELGQTDILKANTGVYITVHFHDSLQKFQ